MSAPLDLEAYAYVGLDEFGSGQLGLKQAIVAAGLIPLVAIERSKLDRPDIREQLAAQAARYKQPISLVRLRWVETLFEISP